MIIDYNHNFQIRIYLLYYSQSQSTVCTTQTSMKSTKIISSMKKIKAKEEAIEIS